MKGEDVNRVVKARFALRLSREFKRRLWLLTIEKTFVGKLSWSIILNC